MRRRSGRKNRFTSEIGIFFPSGVILVATKRTRAYCRSSAIVSCENGGQTHTASISERLHQNYLASHCYGAMTVIYPNISRWSAVYFIMEKWIVKRKVNVLYKSFNIWKYKNPGVLPQFRHRIMRKRRTDPHLTIIPAFFAILYETLGITAPPSSICPTAMNSSRFSAHLHTKKLNVSCSQLMNVCILLWIW